MKGPLLLVLAAAAAATEGDKGHCIWYGQCGQDPDQTASHRKLNCAYDGPAKPASPADLDLLADACPHLARELPADGGSVSLCCDTGQLTDLKRSFALPESLMGRCPACLANFKKNFCDMTCRPNQSHFVNVTRRVSGPTFSGESADMVQEVRYFVHDDYIQAAFDSCRSVVHPATSGSIMSLMCGRWGDTLCTPRRWFDFMGSTANGVSPFEILYEYVSAGEEAAGGFLVHNPESTACHERVENVSLEIQVPERKQGEGVAYVTAFPNLGRCIPPLGVAFAAVMGLGHARPHHSSRHRRRPIPQICRVKARLPAKGPFGGSRFIVIAHGRGNEGAALLH